MMKRRVVLAGVAVFFALCFTAADAGVFTFQDVVQGLSDFREGKVNISYVQERIAGFLGLTDQVPLEVRLDRTIELDPGEGIDAFWSLQARIEEDDSLIESIRLTGEGGDFPDEAVIMVYDEESREWVLPEEAEWETLPSGDMAVTITVQMKDGSVKTENWTADLSEYAYLETLIDERCTEVVLSRNGEVFDPESPDLTLFVLDPFAQVENSFEVDWSGAVSDDYLRLEDFAGVLEEGIIGTGGRMLSHVVAGSVDGHSGIVDFDGTGFEDLFLYEGNLCLDFDLTGKAVLDLPDGFSVGARVAVGVYPDVVVRPWIRMERIFESNAAGDAYDEMKEKKRLDMEFATMAGSRSLTRVRALLGEGTDREIFELTEVGGKGLGDWAEDDFGVMAEESFWLEEYFAKTMEGEQRLIVELTYFDGAELLTRSIDIVMDVTCDPERFPGNPQWFLVFEDSEEEVTEPALGEVFPAAVRIAWENTEDAGSRAGGEGSYWLEDPWYGDVEDEWVWISDPAVDEVVLPIEAEGDADDWFRGKSSVTFGYAGNVLYGVSKVFFPTADPVITANLHLHRYLNDPFTGGDYFDLWVVPRILYPSEVIKEFRMPDPESIDVPIVVNAVDTVHGQAHGYNDDFGFDAGAKITQIVWPGSMVSGSWQAHVPFATVEADMKQEWTFEISYEDRAGTYTETVVMPLDERVVPLLPEVTWYDRFGALVEDEMIWDSDQALLGVEVPFPLQVAYGWFNVFWEYDDGSEVGDWNDMSPAPAIFSAGNALRKAYQVPDDVVSIYAQAGMDVPLSGDVPYMLYWEHRRFDTGDPVLDAHVLIREIEGLLYVDMGGLELSVLTEDMVSQDLWLEGPWGVPVSLNVRGVSTEGLYSVVDLTAAGQWPLATVQASDEITLTLTGSISGEIAQWVRSIPGKADASVSVRTGDSWSELGEGSLIPAGADAIRLDLSGYVSDDTGFELGFSYVGPVAEHRAYQPLQSTDGGLEAALLADSAGVPLMGVCLYQASDGVSIVFGQWGRVTEPVLMPGIIEDAAGGTFKIGYLGFIGPKGLLDDGEPVSVSLSWLESPVEAGLEMFGSQNGLDFAFITTEEGVRAWPDSTAGTLPLDGKSITGTVDMGRITRELDASCLVDPQAPSGTRTASGMEESGLSSLKRRFDLASSLD